jgi:hypothetical protein
MMIAEQIEVRVGHWIVTVLPPDGAVVHQCALCGFAVSCDDVADDMLDPTWFCRFNAELDRVRQTIERHDREVHPEESLAQSLAEFRSQLAGACDPMHGLAAYQWPDTSVRWKSGVLR